MGLVSALDRLDENRPLNPGSGQVGREILRPDQLSIVLVGDASAFADDLKALGFTDFERIPLAQLDLNSPTLKRTPQTGRERPRPRPARPPA